MSRVNAIKYTEIVNPKKDVVLMGEMAHAKNVYKLEVMEVLRQLRHMGFTHFGMEMIPVDIKTDNETLEKHFDFNWSFGTPKNYFFELVKMARQLDMEIVGLDMPYDRYLTAKLPNEHEERNRHFAKEIKKVVDRGHKMIAFMHVAHSLKQSPDDKQDSVRSLLVDEDVSNVSIQLIGGCDRRGDCSPWSNEARAVVKSKKDKLRFYYKDSKPDTYTVHLPQRPVAH